MYFMAMAERIAYQVPVIIEPGCIIPEYRPKKCSDGKEDNIRALCFQTPDPEYVGRYFKGVPFTFDIVPGTLELVERYANLHRQLKREHGDLAQVKWGKFDSILLQLYDDFLSPHAPSLLDFTVDGVLARVARMAGAEGAYRRDLCRVSSSGPCGRQME